jgi:hypothetical protein
LYVEFEVSAGHRRPMPARSVESQREDEFHEDARGASVDPGFGLASLGRSEPVLQ